MTSQIVNKSENFSDNLAAAAGSTVDLVNILVPPRAVMRLKSFGNYVSVVANWGKIRWDFFKNGVPIHPYFAIRDQVGYAAQRQSIENVVIEGGSQLVVRVTQESGIACVPGVSLEWDMEYKG